MLTKAEQEDFQERAAILEYEANLPRAEAEWLARVMVIQARRTRESGRAMTQEQGR